MVGFECSGNDNARGNPLVGNARWGGTSLAALLKEVRLNPAGREVVSLSADTNTEEVAHGGAPLSVQQHFGRSLSAEDATRPEVMLAYEMNGEPLPQPHGAPVRLVVPGWYGVANVKWLDRIHVGDSRFMGRFMSRDYVTVRSEASNSEPVWYETSVSRIRLKSAISRVTRRGSLCNITGFALTDGTPLDRIEVRIDGSPWHRAALSKHNTRYSWQLFTFQWEGARVGEHTIVSRAIDARGNAQPEQADPTKKTRWENNAQFVRTVRIPEPTQ